MKKESDYNNNNDTDFNHNEVNDKHNYGEEEEEDALILPSVRRMATLFQDDDLTGCRSQKPRRIDLNLKAGEDNSSISIILPRGVVLMSIHEDYNDLNHNLLR